MLVHLHSQLLKQESFEEGAGSLRDKTLRDADLQSVERLIIRLQSSATVYVLCIITREHLQARGTHTVLRHVGAYSQV